MIEKRFEHVIGLVLKLGRLLVSEKTEGEMVSKTVVQIICLLDLNYKGIAADVVARLTDYALLENGICIQCLEREVLSGQKLCEICHESSYGKTFGPHDPTQTALLMAECPTDVIH